VDDSTVRHPDFPIGAKTSTTSFNAKSLAKQCVNGILANAGLKLARLGTPDTTDVRDFIPLDETLTAAARAGMSVGDYIDTVLNNIPGATQDTIDAMARLGVFAMPIRSVVEIGPGSGRYLEKVVSICAPERYEIYETSSAWAGYLNSKFKLSVQLTDGRSLRATPDRSTNLVHAHKVFSTIPFWPTCAYWSEMARVAADGGFVVFDIMTEACFDDGTVEAWLQAESQHGSYPAAMPRRLAIDFFTKRGFEQVGTFLVPMGPGKTEYFVFRRSAAG